MFYLSFSDATNRETKSHMIVMLTIGNLGLSNGEQLLCVFKNFCSNAVLLEI